MADRALAGLILIVAAAYGAWLFYRRLAAGGASPASAPSAAAPSGAPSLAPAGTGIAAGGVKLGPAVPLTGPDWAVGKVFRTDAEFSDAVKRSIDRYTQQFRRQGSVPALPPSPYHRFGAAAP